MSNRKHANAALLETGFINGPFFAGLEPVQRLYSHHPQRINEVFASMVRKKLPKAAARTQRLVRTSDDYRWLFGISFSHYGRHATVLMPCMTDGKKEGGTFADRHAAFYYSGEFMSNEERKRTIRKAVNAFEEAYEEMYGHI